MGLQSLQLRDAPSLCPLQSVLVQFLIEDLALGEGLSEGLVEHGFLAEQIRQEVFVVLLHLTHAILSQLLLRGMLLPLLSSPLYLLVHLHQLLAHTGHAVLWDLDTDLLVVLFGFKADNLQDAGAGDVRHHVGYALPHTQQSSTQHVVLTEAHALQTLLTFLYFLTLPIPVGMATLLEGEGELVLPAVPGFLWSHLPVTLLQVVQALRVRLLANVGLVDD